MLSRAIGAIAVLNPPVYFGVSQIRTYELLCQYADFGGSYAPISVATGH